jgi:hypothetical protein
MTVRDYQQMADILKQELNGRYMMADEARLRFDKLNEKVDTHASQVSRFIEKVESFIKDRKYAGIRSDS